MPQPANKLSRRTILQMGLTIPSALLAACVAPARTAPAQVAPAQATSSPPAELLPVEATQLEAEVTELLPTPACDDGDDDPTPAQTEGPFYTPSTPQRTSFLEPGMAGTRMVVAGYVLSTDCRPISGALLDFWHADDAGVYDNSGYTLRGHFFSDEEGLWQLETIVPGLYPGRTRHFHVKVQAANGPVLTTQLYFPNEPVNARDRFFHPDLVMDVQDTTDGKIGTFNFVLRSA
jgi:protocatechuate 3,4-dioxygenase beta subunit